MAHVGDGQERRAVFVPRAAPGDVVLADVDFRKRPARADVVRLLEPSSLREPAACPLVERCGGCDLMHVTREARHEVHRRIVADVIARATGAAYGDIVFHPAPSATRYRTRARLAVLAGNGRAVVGYRRAESRHIEDVAACLVLDARIEAALPLLKESFSHQAGEGEVAIALGDASRPVLEVRWRGALDGTFYAALARHVESGALAGAEIWLPDVREPARIGDPRVVTTGADGAPLVVPPGGFAQAHPALNVELGNRVLASIEIEEGRPLVELFAGSGNFTVLLARHTSALVAVESDRRAVVAARANLASRGLSARIVEADADAFDLPRAARAVLLDPPRTGAAGAAARIAASKVRRVVYVSCDATTLGRDVATLARSGFRVSRVDMFEMFPFTSHVELLAALDRDPGDRRRESA